MTTRLDGILKRELLIAREPYTLTLSEQGFTLALKGRRKGVGYPMGGSGRRRRSAGDGAERVADREHRAASQRRDQAKALTRSPFECDEGRSDAVTLTWDPIDGGMFLPRFPKG